MNLLVISIGPVFRSQVHGGSQRILREIVTHLGACGHRVTVLCTKRADNSEPFSLSPGVQVEPILRLKETYPEPYYTAPFNLSRLVVDVSRFIKSADALYLHDAQLAYRFLYRDIPTIISFRDFLYADTLAAALSFRRDALIVNSEYLRDCVSDAFAAFCPSVDSRIHTIPNGVDLAHFRPQSAAMMRERLGLTETMIPVLCPHRPEPRKGVFEALEAIGHLKKRSPQLVNNIRLLIPVWMDTNIAGGSGHAFQTQYQNVQRQAERLGLQDVPLLHPWIDYDAMPAYYSIGAVTLCAGSIVETFGNVQAESLACGTPVVVSRVAAQRHVLPDSMAKKVDYGDSRGLADAIEQALVAPPSEQEVERWRAHLGSVYPHARMLQLYERVICGTSRLAELDEEYESEVSGDDVLSLPAWCAVLASGIYNDYAYGYDATKSLAHFVERFGKSATVSASLDAGITKEAIAKLVSAGVLIRRKGVLR